MKISRLALRGVSALPDLECDFSAGPAGRPHDLVIVHGPPASGKTRLLELMLAALEIVGPYVGIVRASDWVADPAAPARVEIDVALEADGSAEPPPAAMAYGVVTFGASVTSQIDRSARRWLSRYDHDPAHGKREYFPESRQRAWGARRDGLAPHEQALLRSSRDPQKFSFVPRFLADLRFDPRRGPAFAAGLELLSPTIRYMPVARSAEPAKCFKDAHDPARVGVHYDELSSSEADAVIIAATAALVGLNHSIVFLDRPELYVPPTRLIEWVRALARLGQNNQWIVATSDEALAASVHKSQLVALGSAAAAGARRPS